MGWKKSAAILAGAACVAFLAGAASAQQANVRRIEVNVTPASASEAVNHSIANAAARSTWPHAKQAELSRQDLVNLMVLLSLPNNAHKSF